jgi:hypothetical protein
MQILNSEWLVKMLQKSGTTPDVRLLSLFDILSDWLTAPQIHASLKIETINNHTPYLLLNYLSQQAKEAGAAMPEMLAEQLIFIAKSALKDCIENIECASFAHAKQVANALISAQCEREAIQLKKSTIYSALDIFVGAITIGALTYRYPQSAPGHSDISTAMFEQTNSKNDEDVASNPKETADMYASIETMRGGDCQYIEALQIPDADKKIYLENVVGGQAPTNVHDQLIAQHYLQKIRCNYTPMLMKNSTN